MEKILTEKPFDVNDETVGTTIAENLKTFEEAETLVIAHDKKRHTDWLLASIRDPERTEEFKHHRYLIYHYEAYGWRAISVVEFKF